MYYSLDKRYHFEGLVITNDYVLADNLTNLVLVLQKPMGLSNDDMRIVGIHSSAFEMSPDNISVTDFAEHKRTKRIKSKPLLFGDIIVWNPDDMMSKTGVVMNFSRSTSFYDTRVTKDGKQIKVGGVLNPKTPKFWTYLSQIRVEPVMANEVEPDVWVNAWLLANVNGTSPSTASVKFMVVEFADFDPENQCKVSETPWNKELPTSKFSSVPIELDVEDDDFEIPVEKPLRVFKRQQNEWDENIQRQVCLFTGNRLFISKDMPKFDFIVPIKTPYNYSKDGKKPIYPVIGEYYFVDATWSTIHKCFLITKILPAPTMKIHKRTKSENIVASVVPAEYYDGFFRDIDGTLGLIDDPFGLLALWKFFVDQQKVKSEPFCAKVELKAVRATENQSARFRILKRCSITKGIMKEFEEWLQNEQIICKNITGTFINEDTAISPEHQNIFFKYDVSSSHIRWEPGTKVHFDAKYIKETQNKFQMHNVQSIPKDPSFVEFTKRYIGEVSSKKSIIMKIHLTRDPNYDQLLRSSVFGFIDRRDFEKEITKKEFCAWVMISPLAKKIRRACTVLEVIATSHKAPVGVQKSIAIAGTTKQLGIRTSTPAVNKSLLDSTIDNFDRMSMITSRFSIKASEYNN